MVFKDVNPKKKSDSKRGRSDRSKDNDTPIDFKKATENLKRLQKAKKKSLLQQN